MLGGKPSAAGMMLRILLSPLTYVWPRSKRIWLFGNRHGFSGEPRYFMEYASHHARGVALIWMADSEVALCEAKHHGFRAYHKLSILGVWYSLRAGVQFIACGFKDQNRSLALGARVITFWHGTPMKMIGLDYFSIRHLALTAWARKVLYRALNRNIWIYYAASPIEAKLVGHALGIPREKINVLGAPRFDRMRESKLKQHLHAPLRDARLVLFAPTWRDGGFGLDYALPATLQERLREVLKVRNYVLVTKRHPLTSYADSCAWGLPNDPRILDSASLGENDINNMYADSDVVISDISSCLFDACAVGCKTIMFMPDVDRYVETHDVYPYIRDLVLHNVIRTWSSLIDALDGEEAVRTVDLTNVCNLAHGAESTCASIYADLCRRLRLPVVERAPIAVRDE